MEDIFLENSLLTDLDFSLFFIGFKSSGESIIFIIKERGTLLYSGIIDCFKLRECDMIGDILKNEGVDKLDFISLTHPHYDHSKGIDQILEKYSKPETKLVISDHMIGRNEEKFGLTAAERDTFEKIKEKIMEENHNYLSSSVSRHEARPVENFIITDKVGNTLPFKISSLAPNNLLLNKAHLKENKNIDVNLFSLAFFLEFGDLKVFLGGDVEDDTINLIKNDFIDQAHIIKIPHHSSDTSSSLINKIIKRNKVACSSFSTRHGLPLTAVLQGYSQKVDKVYLTGNLNSKKNTEKYGFIKYHYQYSLSETISLKVETSGNAGVF